MKIKILQSLLSKSSICKSTSNPLILPDDLEPYIIPIGTIIDLGKEKMTASYNYICPSPLDKKSHLLFWNEDIRNLERKGYIEILSEDKVNKRN